RVRREKIVAGRDRHDGALLVAARDQVAQVPPPRAAQEALIPHPEVVVHLGKVLAAAVADEGDDAPGRRLRAAVAERGGDERPGRRAPEDALVAQEGAGGEEALLVLDGEGLADAGEVA